MTHSEGKQRRGIGRGRGGLLSARAPVLSIHGSAAGITDSGADRRRRHRSSA
jgi:hypothetical protein